MPADLHEEKFENANNINKSELKIHVVNTAILPISARFRIEIKLDEI